MAPNGLKICWGVKVNGSRRLRCVEEVDDPRVVEETMRLINEFINRVERHRDVLLSDSATPFDEPINALSNLLRMIETKVKEGNNENTTNLRRAILDVGRAMLRLAKRAHKKWLKTYKSELEELIEKLRSNGARVVISGEPLDKDKSFMAHLYTKHLAIVVNRVAKVESLTIQISFTGLKGIHVVVPKLFSGNRLRAMQCGLLLTDGSIDKKGYPEMGTHQLWQAIAWLIAWPGKNSVRIHGLGLNDNVNIKWQLKAVDHRGVFKNKLEVAEETSKLGDGEFPTFTLYAVLSDGDVNAKRKRVRLYMGYSKLELWSGIIEKLKSLGFGMDRDKGHTIAYAIRSSKAIELARKMLGDSAIKTLVEDLAQLPDAEKPRRLIELAGMEPKHLGKSSIEVVDGVKMTVCVSNGGSVELKVQRKDYNDAMRIQERLKRAGYEAGLRPSGDYFEIYISMYVIERDQELARRVCEVLRRMLEEAVNKGRERRAKAITRAMERLNCPTQSPRAQQKQ